MTILIGNKYISKICNLKEWKLIKLMLKYELFEEQIFLSSDSDFFQNYLEFLYLYGGKNNENEFGDEDSN